MDQEHDGSRVYREDGRRIQNRAERRDKPIRSKAGLEVMCRALLRRVHGMPAIERVVVNAAALSAAGHTWHVAALVPQQPVKVMTAARAALESWRDRFDLAAGPME